MALTGTCLALLALLLILAAIGDLRTRMIPNRLCLAIAGLAIPFRLLSLPGLLDHAAMQFALWIVAMPILLLLFARRAMGGGDVKLIAALLLWLTPREALTVFIVTALAGGAIGTGILISAWGRKSPSVPYGVAIASGGLAFIYEQLAPIILP